MPRGIPTCDAAESEDSDAVDEGAVDPDGVVEDVHGEQVEDPAPLEDVPRAHLPAHVLQRVLLLQPTQNELVRMKNKIEQGSLRRTRLRH